MDESDKSARIGWKILSVWAALVVYLILNNANNLQGENPDKYISYFFILVNILSILSFIIFYKSWKQKVSKSNQVGLLLSVIVLATPIISLFYIFYLK